MQVTILCDKTSNRLEYTLDFIFNEVLKTGYRLLHDRETLVEGPLIVYHEQIIEGSYHIKNEGLLFEENIRRHHPLVNGTGEHTILFPVEGTQSFDIFSAVFYLISRYEEYLPYKKDLYHRYPHTDSLASKNSFLNYPVVDKWLIQLAEKLHSLFPEFKPQLPSFSWLPTYDVDMAWSYLNKGFLRNLGGFLKSPGLDRLLALARLKPDPFDSFSFLHYLHERYELNPIYFWLVPQKRGKLDRNISPHHPAMKALIKKHKKYSIGIHPSWYARDNKAALQEEIDILEQMTGLQITSSRQHYLRFTLPETYENLANVGIKDEYSMGYGSTNGFRASTSNSFYWFNLKRNQKTSLKVHPFCFMDANTFYEHGLTVEEAYQELLNYRDTCRDTGGTMVTIFHNNFLGTDPQHSGWKEMYERFIQAVHS